MEKQLEAVCSRIKQLQAADVPSALRGLLKQAHTMLKPPSRSAGAAGAPPPGSTASRHSLVLGILALLERAALLASQQRDSNLIKDVQAQLLSAFKQRSWLWELLLRKHLADLLQHATAAQLFAEAAAGLPSATQARVYCLWRQQLLQSQHAPQPLRLPPVLQQQLFEQLKLCFHAHTVTLPLLPGKVEQGGAGSSSMAAVGAAPGEPGLPDPMGAEVRVMLREQLPHLLHLVLTTCCGGGTDGSYLSDVAHSQRHEDGSSGRASGNVPHAPCLSSMQSSAAGVRAHRRQQPGSSGHRAEQHAAFATASSPADACSQGGGASIGGGTCSVRDGLLRHAVLLVSRLSDPDTLHDMLAIPAQQHARGSAASSDSDGGGREARQALAAGRAAAQPFEQHQAQHLVSRRDLGKVQTALALIEVCLDGMLTLPPLATAVHCELHSKGSSTGSGNGRLAQQGVQQGGSAAGMGGEGTGLQVDAETTDAALAGEEQVAAAAAAEEELRHTAGLMLGMHRELSRLCSELQQQQSEGSRPGRSGGARQRQQVQLLSLPACQRLLHMLAAVQQQQEVDPTAAAHPSASGNDQKQQGDGNLAGSSTGTGPGRRQSMAHVERCTLTPGAPWGAPALLLVPPQLAAQGIELVRQSVEASESNTSAQHSSMCMGTSWHVDMAERVAAIYLACYQAMWGARVLQSAEAYQLLLSAARLRMLLHGGGSLAGGAGAADDEAAAEAALVAHNMVGSRRRRPRSSAHELAGLGGGGAAAAAAGSVPPGPAAKRLKPDPKGSSGGAVQELLQLFQVPTPVQELQGHETAAAAGGSSLRGRQQQQQAGRRRVMAVPVEQERHDIEQPAVAPPCKRITPQQIAASPSSVATAAATDVLQLLAGGQQQQQVAGVSGGGSGDTAAHAEQEEAAVPGEERSQQRVVISKATNMTEEQQEEMWAAYIADKEFLVEMLGDADYQQWYDEEAHPLRKQQRRAGGLEAAWAAVLGGPAAGSLVQRELPCTLMEASSQMPWDAAAAACLHLLRLLLHGAVPAGSGVAAVTARAADGGMAAGMQHEQQTLLLRAFNLRLRKEGAKAAANALLGITGSMHIATAIKTAQAAPAGGALLLLSAQLLGLVRGERSLAESPLFGGAQCDVRIERQLQGQQWVPGSSRLTAPPLLDAYAQLLAELLRMAQLEAAADPTYGSGRPFQQHQRHVLPINLSAALVTRLMLLPPPTQHMLAPGCARLLRLAVVDGGGQQAVLQLAALLWMLAQGQSVGGHGRSGSGVVRLPPNCPRWLEGEALIIEGPRDDSSHGHVLLLGPAREVQQAAAAELLAQLRQHLQQLLHEQREQPAGENTVVAAAVAEPGLPTEGVLPVADACHAAIQLLLLEHQHQHRQRQASDDGCDADSEEEEEEEEEGELGQALLLGNPAAVVEIASLAAALCQAGVAAGGVVAAAIDVAVTAAGGSGPTLAQQQQQPAAKEGEGYEAASRAAGVLALCNQFLEAADRLLQSGCLPPDVQQQLEAACEQLEGQLQAVEQLCQRLPQDHPLLCAMEAAMEAAPVLWQPAAEEEEEETEGGGGGSGEEEEEQGSGRPHLLSKQQQLAAGGRQQARRKRRGRRMADVRNPGLRAMLAEDGCGGELDAEDLSDLEDFIVCNPDRDYESFFRLHFWQARGSDSEEEEAGGGRELQPRQQAPQWRGAAGKKCGKAKGQPGE